MADAGNRSALPGQVQNHALLLSLKHDVAFREGLKQVTVEYMTHDLGTVGLLALDEDAHQPIGLIPVQHPHQLGFAGGVQLFSLEQGKHHVIHGVVGALLPQVLPL